jgi:hypothetical protein
VEKVKALVREFKTQIVAGLSGIVTWIAVEFIGLPERWRWGVIGFAAGVFTAILLGGLIRWFRTRPSVALQNCADKAAAFRKYLYELSELKQRESAWQCIGPIWLAIHVKAQNFDNHPTANAARELNEMWDALCKSIAPCLSDSEREKLAVKESEFQTSLKRVGS